MPHPPGKRAAVNPRSTCQPHMVSTVPRPVLKDMVSVHYGLHLVLRASVLAGPDHAICVCRSDVTAALQPMMKASVSDRDSGTEDLAPQKGSNHTACFSSHRPTAAVSKFLVLKETRQNSSHRYSLKHHTLAS